MSTISLLLVLLQYCLFGPKTTGHNFCCVFTIVTKLTASGSCRHGKLVKKYLLIQLYHCQFLNPRSDCHKLAKKATLFMIISISKYLIINSFITNNDLTFILQSIQQSSHIEALHISTADYVPLRISIEMQQKNW